jgi:enamine deaminase RidA (YjgF/YER057c/UK114 family)
MWSRVNGVLEWNGVNEIIRPRFPGVLAKIKHLLEAAGGHMDDVVKVNIFVTDITRREEVWKARREFFTGNFPVSTLVEVSALATPELLVEIEAVAILGAAPQ